MHRLLTARLLASLLALGSIAAVSAQSPAVQSSAVQQHLAAAKAGGAKLLQDRFGSRVILSAADWDMLDRQNPPWKPKRDMVASECAKAALVGLPGATN